MSAHMSHAQCLRCICMSIHMSHAQWLRCICMSIHMSHAQCLRCMCMSIHMSRVQRLLSDAWLRHLGESDMSIHHVKPHLSCNGIFGVTVWCGILHRSALPCGTSLLICLHTCPCTCPCTHRYKCLCTCLCVHPYKIYRSDCTHVNTMTMHESTHMSINMPIDMWNKMPMPHITDSMVYSGVLV